MRLEKVCDFLKTQPRYRDSGSQVMLKCWICNDSGKNDKPGNMSIKIDVEPGEPMVYHCFRSACGASGFLRTEDLQTMGCNDIDTLMELSAWNREVNPRLEKKFHAKENRGYQLVNLAISDNLGKLKYINTRLGTSFEFQDLRNYKIQLGLYEFLRINRINRLAFAEDKCDLLDEYTIGFLSMYSDYLICRDITKKIVTGNRYTTYRIRGKAKEDDMKIYCIPGELDILDPNPVDINIAEGTFSILGAYLNTNLRKKQKNQIWLANCGSGYKTTLLHTSRQFGLLDVNLHIWSDSEIKIGKYERLMQDAKDHMHLNSVTVYYDGIAEDFGHSKNQIRVESVELK